MTNQNQPIPAQAPDAQPVTLSPLCRYRKDLFAKLENGRFYGNSYTPHSREVYFSGFATVQVSVSEREVTIERYYDNETIDIDRHFSRSIPHDGETFPPVSEVCALAFRLLATVRSEEPILNFGE
jgi:hypothetical protein